MMTHKNKRTNVSIFELWAEFKIANNMYIEFQAKEEGGDSLIDVWKDVMESIKVDSKAEVFVI